MLLNSLFFRVFTKLKISLPLNLFVYSFSIHLKDMRSSLISAYHPAYSNISRICCLSQTFLQLSFFSKIFVVFCLRSSTVLKCWWYVAVRRIPTYTRFQCYVHRQHLRSSFDMPSFDMLFKRLFNCETGNFSYY